MIVQVSDDLLRCADDPRQTIFLSEVKEWFEENLSHVPTLRWTIQSSWPWESYYVVFEYDSDALLFKMSWNDFIDFEVSFCYICTWSG